MKYKVELRCEKCDKILNETTELDNLDLAERCKQDALVNPLLGWCKECDAKPTPHIVELKS